MASWVMHLQMAEALLKGGYKFDPLPFLIGSIAPDTGSPVNFHDRYDPPKEITHWEDQSGKIEEERFFKEEVGEKFQDWDRFSFLIGYYTHLKADNLWREIVWKPLYSDPQIGHRLQNNIRFLEEVYLDIHAYDANYLIQHPNFIYFTQFVLIENTPNYLSIFSEEGVVNHIKQIKRHYHWATNNLQNHEWQFISPRSLEDFVSEVTEKLLNTISEKL